MTRRNLTHLGRHLLERLELLQTHRARRLFEYLRALRERTHARDFLATKDDLGRRFLLRLDDAEQ